MGPPRSTNHGSLVCASLPATKGLRSWTRKVPDLELRISLTAVSEPKGQTDGNPLFEAAGLWDNCGHLQKWRRRKRGRVPERSGRDTFGDISSPLASYDASKTNNRTEPLNQQNQTLRYGR